ncbi:hypothetical protein, partial [Escherichia coli]|uniref:hypothetical protein n=1 Tax=Escherichia coli TaxID=562 RepID=UPI00396C68E9
WKGWAILLRQKQKKLIMLPSETMIWQPEFTDKILSRKPGAVHNNLFTNNNTVNAPFPWLSARGYLLNISFEKDNTVNYFYELSHGLINTLS